MWQKKSLLYLLILTMFLNFHLISCGGGGGGGGTAADPLIVFVTSATGQGNLGDWADAGTNTGLAAGDAICQAAADDAGLPGTYKAWLSDDTTDAYCHILGHDGETVSSNCGQTSLPTNAGPWVRTDGHPFAPTIDELINSGVVYTPVRYDEYGTVVATGDAHWYFTNTNPDGTKSGSHCLNWTSGNAGDNAYLGRTAGTTNWWSGVTGVNCSVSARLLCFQTGTGGSLPPITAPAGAKKVFVTSVQGTGNLTSWADYSGSATGAAAGDTICQNRAQAEGLANYDKYKAWLSNSTTNAIARLSSDGPWYRLDGVKVADNKAALAVSSSGHLFTAITYTETGNYITGNVRVWTATDDNGAGFADNCGNWVDADSPNQVTVGDMHMSDGYWTSFTVRACNLTAALYCFEDE